MEAAVTPLGHSEAQALFAPLVDRELEPGEEAALRSHLDACAECRQGWERYERAVALVRGVARERAPKDFAVGVVRRVRRRRRGAFGLQGARFFEQVSIPAEAAIPVIIAAIVAAILVFASF